MKEALVNMTILEIGKYYITSQRILIFRLINLLKLSKIITENYLDNTEFIYSSPMKPFMV